MGRKRDLTDYQKGSIDALINEGFSQAYVAAKLRINKSTVSRFVNGKGSSKKNSGRKKMTNGRQDRTLKRLCLANRKLSSIELAREWEDSILAYTQNPAPSVNVFVHLDSYLDAWLRNPFSRINIAWPESHGVERTKTGPKISGNVFSSRMNRRSRWHTTPATPESDGILGKQTDLVPITDSETSIQPDDMVRLQCARNWLPPSLRENCWLQRVREDPENSCFDVSKSVLRWGHDVPRWLSSCTQVQGHKRF